MNIESYDLLQMKKMQYRFSEKRISEKRSFIVIDVID